MVNGKIAVFVIPLKKLDLSGCYPAILIGKWFVIIDTVTYAQHAKSKFWFGFRGYSAPVARM